MRALEALSTGLCPIAHDLNAKILGLILGFRKTGIAFLRIRVMSGGRQMPYTGGQYTITEMLQQQLSHHPVAMTTTAAYITCLL